MGSKAPKAPPPPNYTSLINLAKAQGDKAYALQQQQFEWAKNTYAENAALTKQYVSRLMGYMDEQAGIAREDRERYTSVFQPLEDDLVNEAWRYGTKEERARQQGAAIAEVGQQFDAARENSLRQLEDYGIDPSSTRFAALDLGVRTQEAAAKAAASDAAARHVENTQRALRSEAIGLGRQLPGDVRASYAGAQGAGGAGVNAQLATTASGANTMGTPAQWAGIGAGHLGAAGNLTANSYSSQMDAAKFNAEQDKQSDGWGSLLGLAAGIGSKAFLGPTAPWVMGADDGGAIPTGASPTGGAIPDDIPARLSAGEFVVPKEAVQWKGEEFFHKLITKAREGKEEAIKLSGAVPTPGAPLPGQAGALPVG